MRITVNPSLRRISNFDVHKALVPGCGASWASFTREKGMTFVVGMSSLFLEIKIIFCLLPRDELNLYRPRIKFVSRIVTCGGLQFLCG